jgi:hypothetical protein
MYETISLSTHTPLSELGTSRDSSMPIVSACTDSGCSLLAPVKKIFLVTAISKTS